MKRVLRQKRFVVPSITLVLVAAAIGALWVGRNNSQSQAEPIFIFHSGQASDWWSPGSYPSQPDEPNWPEGLGASITIFEGSRQEAGDCHISFFYYAKDNDPEAARKEREGRTVFGSGNMSLEQRGNIVMTMQTPEGKKAYELYQYEMIGNEDGPLKRGIQFGYLSLEESYIEVQSHCAEYAGLAKTLPILPAIEFKARDTVSDRCVPDDWFNDNCVPVGQCQPDSVANQIVDCFDKVKDYDSKFNPDI